MNAESLVAYLLAIRLFRGVAPRTIVSAMSLFVMVCITGAILAFLRVPGFDPVIPPDILVGSPDYINYLASFYARLSHPFIGLSNDFASALNCYVLVLFAWGFAENRRAYQLLAALTVLAITFTLSRGVLISLVFTGMVFFLKPRLRRYAGPGWVGCSA